jgi:hypothetical protein
MSPERSKSSEILSICRKNLALRFVSGDAFLWLTFFSKKKGDKKSHTNKI